MRVADRLTQREASWRELERLVDQVSERHIRHCQPIDSLRNEGAGRDDTAMAGFYIQPH